MQKIINPWLGVEGYNCFGCAPSNEHGLQMEFFEDGDEVICKWNPKSHFQGWLDTLHGGIQCALLDEIAAWVVIKEMQTCGVTTKMQTRFMKSIDTSKGEITLKAKMVNKLRNIAVIEAQIFNHQNELCSKAEIYYFTYSQEIAKEKFYFRKLNTDK